MASTAAWRALRALLWSGDPGPAPSWAELADAAREGEVVALACAAHRELARRLGPDLEAAMLHDMLLERTERAVVLALAAAGVERAAALKGSAAGHWVYARSGLRQRRDLDVLVSERDLGPAWGALEGAGFERILGTAWFAAEDPPYEVTLAAGTPGGRVECDLHGRLTAWRALPIDHAGILERATSRGARALAVTSPEDTLLHTSLHAATTGYTVALKSWLDAARLFSYPALDLEALRTRAAVWRLSTALWAAREVCARWFGLAPAPGWESLRPAAPQALALRRLLAGEGATVIAGPAALARGLALGGPLTWGRMLAQRARAGFCASRKRL